MQTQILSGNERPSSVAYLIPVQPSGKTCEQRQAIVLDEFVTIGRDAGCRLRIEDPYISSRHARIERQTHGWTIRDQASRNGIYLNGSRVGEATLAPNDRIRIGESLFVFSETAGGAAPLKSRNLLWNDVLRRLPAFALVDFPVLISGASGSGKDVLARWLHSASPRSRGPFISINCSALSESLIESELFGHVRGSFTGAINDRKGAFEAARDGVLFLDEIGDLPLALQPKLLRALENAEIRPVGSDRVVETDVRIFAATHKDLAALVRCGQFREDLYYRLCVCGVRAPALRDRMEDFDELIYKFAKSMKVRFSFAAIEALKKHDWPGNVRELKNAVARAAAYFPGQHIQARDVDSLIDRLRAPVYGGARQDVGHVDYASGAPNHGTQGQLIKELERDMILQRLIANGGNQRRTADELGLAKSTLHDRIKSYNIDISAAISAQKGAFKA